MIFTITVSFLTCKLIIIFFPYSLDILLCWNVSDCFPWKFWASVNQHSIQIFKRKNSLTICPLAKPRNKLKAKFSRNNDNWPYWQLYKFFTFLNVVNPIHFEATLELLFDIVIKGLVLFALILIQVDNSEVSHFLI